MESPANSHPSYALFGPILETALDAVVVVDADGVVIGWNRVAEDTFGWSRHEAVGRPLNCLIVPESHKAAHQAGFDRFLATGEAHVLGRRVELSALRKDGEEIPVELSIAAADFGHGQVFIGYLRDISERKDAEQAARQQSSILAQLTEGVIIANAAGRLTFVNDAAARLHGVDELGVTPDRYSDTYHLYTVDGRPYPPQELPLARALTGETVDEGRWKIRRPDGTEVLAMGNAQPILDAQGNQVAAVVTVRDETARYAAEQQVRESEARLRTLTDNLPSGMVYQISTGQDGSDRKFLFVSQSNQRLTGVPAEAVMRDPMVAYNLIHPEDRAKLVEAETQAIRSRAPFDVEVRFHHATGEQRWCRILSAPREQPDGSLIWDGLQIDITDRKRAEETRAASEARLRALFDQAAAGIAQTDLTGRFVEANDHYCKMVGRSRRELLKLRMQDITHPDDLGRNLPDFDSTAKGGASFEIEKRYVRPDGSVVWVRNSVSAVRGPSGEKIEGVLAVSVDITDRKLAEQALHDLNHSLERRVTERTAERNLLATLVETTDVMVMACDLEFNILAINSANADEFERVYGIRPRAGDNLLALLDGHPEHRAQVEAGWAPALAGEEYTIVDEFGDPDRDRPYYEVSFRTLRNAEGDRVGAYHFVTDVTPRLRAETTLRETQEALRQSQKMEAMGQLTGGVAHDFNNLLTPIVGALDLLLRRGLGSEREQRLIAGALQSADRAATLVQRLLAFARRQPLQAAAVDLETLIEGMAELIRSTLGPGIELRIDVDAALPPASADPNQLEMALLNLAVNARDAMPDGGMLTISAARETVTANQQAHLAPGHYLRLSVEDTGVGMDAETARRAVEPFFSTKGIGKGTGLGLSMVHGLAAQLGGGVTLDSEPGRGTVIDMWLPISLDPVSGETERPVAPSPAEARGRVLLVDDEVLVRMSTADMLGELGYEVSEASSGEAALQLLEGGETYDLLVTDQLMAGMSGIDLAEKAAALHPDLPVLIASGYSESDSAASRWLRLTKPFRKSELAERLAELQKNGSRDQ